VQLIEFLCEPFSEHLKKEIVAEQHLHLHMLHAGACRQLEKVQSMMKQSNPELHALASQLLNELNNGEFKRYRIDSVIIEPSGNQAFTSVTRILALCYRVIQSEQDRDYRTYKELLWPLTKLSYTLPDTPALTNDLIIPAIDYLLSTLKILTAAEQQWLQEDPTSFSLASRLYEVFCWLLEELVTVVKRHDPQNAVFTRLCDELTVLSRLSRGRQGPPHFSALAQRLQLSLQMSYLELYQQTSEYTLKSALSPEARDVLEAIMRILMDDMKFAHFHPKHIVVPDNNRAEFEVFIEICQTCFRAIDTELSIHLNTAPLIPYLTHLLELTNSKNFLAIGYSNSRWVARKMSVLKANPDLVKAITALHARATRLAAPDPLETYKRLIQREHIDWNALDRELDKNEAARTAFIQNQGLHNLFLIYHSSHLPYKGAYSNEFVVMWHNLLAEQLKNMTRVDALLRSSSANASDKEAYKKKLCQFARLSTEADAIATRTQLISLLTQSVCGDEEQIANQFKIGAQYLYVSLLSNLTRQLGQPQPEIAHNVLQSLKDVLTGGYLAKFSPDHPSLEQDSNHDLDAFTVILTDCENVIGNPENLQERLLVSGTAPADLFELLLQTEKETQAVGGSVRTLLGFAPSADPHVSCLRRNPALCEAIKKLINYVTPQNVVVDEKKATETREETQRFHDSL
jgi:hypothetical protein